jgi:hypothetical protein
MKLKVGLCPSSTPWRNLGGRVKEMLHIFLTLELDGYEWLDGTHVVQTIAALDTVGKRRTPSLVGIKFQLYSLWPVILLIELELELVD